MPDLKDSVKTSILAAVFFFSGFAALMYQVAWQRLLTIHYGVGAVSITIIVTVYMFGLGIGALAGGAISERTQSRVRLYFAIELLIGLFGLLSLSFLNALGKATAGESAALSLLYVALFLAVPTFLMGSTLPILVKIYNGYKRNVLGSVSFLYFINTMGAAAGSAFTAYVVVGFWGLDAAVYLAALINLILSGMIFYIGKEDKTFGAKAPGKDEPLDDMLGRLAYPLVLVTGFVAIGYEIVWFRVIGTLVKASPYSFATVLSVYLVGIALGSFIMERRARGLCGADKKSLFFIIQFFIGVSALLSIVIYYRLTEHTPFSAVTRASFMVEIHPSLPDGPGLTRFMAATDVLFWPLFIELVPALFIGAGFPLVAYLAQTRSGREGGAVGWVYFFNAAGNVLGAAVTGFVLLKYLGSEITLLVFGFVNVFMLVFAARGLGRKFPIKFRVPAAALTFTVLALFFPTGGELYKAIHQSPGEGFTEFFKEGVDTVVMTYRKAPYLTNYIGGMGHGGRPGWFFIAETSEALTHLSSTGDVLVIGFGTGTLTETVLLMQDLKSVTVVELSETLMTNLLKMDLFRDVLSDSRINLVIDDGRRYLQASDKQYDLVLMDPLRVTTSYANNLYSREFFELVKSRMKPGGVFMIWMDDDRTVPKTAATAFERVKFYRLGLVQYFALASDQPLIKRDTRQRYIESRMNPQVLERVNAVWARSLYLGDEEYVKRTYAEGPINEDMKPRGEYYLGLKSD